jgi:hypothetical protein
MTPALQGTSEIPLTVFGSLVTETAAVNLPEGVSPDCQDVVFRPGSVQSRPALQKVFATPFGAATVNYLKSYVDNTGTIRNLYLDSAGNLWLEDVSNAPGFYALLTTVTPGSYAKSVTAFGKEYIAFNDTLHGSDVPLQFDGTNLDRVTQDGPGAAPNIANLIIPAVATNPAPASLTRLANIVTAQTAAAHGMQVGYLAQISGISSQPVGFIASIVIDNEDEPGIATVTMSTPHGLSPGLNVSIQNPPDVAVGGAVTSAELAGEILTVGLTAAHGLQAGQVVQVVLTGGSGALSGLNAALVVSDIPSLTSLQFVFPNSDTSNDTASGGTVSLKWPISDQTPPIFWEVQQCPSNLVFQVAINYGDGTWTGGGAGVFLPWNGTFFVASVPSPESFTYQSQGPDGNTTDTGMVTPTGQAAPGNHQMQVLFLTRQGYVTEPSPPVKFIANGGQYLQITNIPTGPANVVARILAFTGAQGAYFFYIPVPAQIQGQQVSTATQINDNVTTSIVLDFSDNTLFAATGITTQGNWLAQQILLDGALGFGYYASRLLTWGQRNRIQNLLNMGFDGGQLPSNPGKPTGWTSSNGHLASARFGESYLFTGAGSLSQSFYQDVYGAPIATPNTFYNIRAFIAGLGNITFTISSVLGAFSTSVTLTGVQAGGSYISGSFPNPMPNAIPSDMVLTITGVNGVSIDELSIIFADDPYTETIINGSYVQNPEAFDGVSGDFGPVDDTHKVMDLGIIRSTLYMLTQDPSGRIHSTINNGVTEPAGWTINEVAANCGLLSAFGLTKSQADDSAASGGEEWFAYASSSGARIFSGNEPWKISQEIQPDWDELDPGSVTSIWALNDPVGRLIYWGLAFALSNPGPIYALDYRELDTAQQIAGAAPIHTSFSGKLIATDHTRKWTRWNMAIKNAAMMYREPGALAVVFGSGSIFPSMGFGNVYTLNPNKYTDDDFGQIFPYYVTCFFPTGDQRQAFQLGAGQVMLAFLRWLVSGIGYITITPFKNTISNQWPLTGIRTMSEDPIEDLEWGGGNCQGFRIAFKISSSPITGTDNSFNLQKLEPAFSKSIMTPVRGAL